MSATTAAAASTGTKDKRKRKGVQRDGMVSSEAALTEGGQLSALITESQRASAAAQQHEQDNAAAAASLQLGHHADDMGDHDIDEQSVHSDAEFEDESDAVAHNNSTAKNSTAAKSSARASNATRVKWTQADMLALCSSLLQYAASNQGLLPSAARSGKRAKVPAGWDEVTKPLKLLNSLADQTAAQRAASAKWAKLRVDVSVSSTAHHLCLSCNVAAD